MTKISLITIGKFKSSECKSLVDYYLKLIGRFASIELVELANESALPKWLERKGSRVHLTILDERGKLFTSREFSARIEKIKNGSYTEWAIAVGGAHGYDEEIRAKAQLLWSLSPLTFAHELALVVATEQVFRALTILNNHPYHND